MSTSTGIGVSIWEYGTWHSGLQAQPAPSFIFLIQIERMEKIIDLKTSAQKDKVTGCAVFR